MVPPLALLSAILRSGKKHIVQDNVTLFKLDLSRVTELSCGLRSVMLRYKSDNNYVPAVTLANDCSPVDAESVTEYDKVCLKSIQNVMIISAIKALSTQPHVKIGIDVRYIESHFLALP